jgi:Protein of unknown function (DUF1064)
VSQVKPSKYRNHKTLYQGIQFDSQKEANRYQELVLMERAGLICNLEGNKTSAKTKELIGIGDPGGEASLAGFGGLGLSFPFPQKVSGFCTRERFG